MTPYFAVTGVAGRVAPRHLEAIRAVGGKLVAALDPHDSAAVLDRYDLDVPFFTEPESFERYLETALRSVEDEAHRYLTVCSPNHLHEAHCRVGLHLGIDVICEKPVVLTPGGLDTLAALEADSGRHIWTVLQLRMHPPLLALRERLQRTRASKHEVTLTYIAPRGRWYDVSWKGCAEKSGGIVTNIGVHMFDLLTWLFGSPGRHRLHLREERRLAGSIELERAHVSWFLSIDGRDIPEAERKAGRTALRSMAIDGTTIDFSAVSSDLHVRVYEEILGGRGLGLSDARSSIEMAHTIRQSAVESRNGLVHPLLTT